MIISGIYKIQSKCNPNRIYIGSSSDIKKRWNLHLINLRKGKHHSIKLQRHYNKYGEKDLEFSIIMNCDQEDMIKSEQFFMDTYKTWFNILPTAYSVIGLKWKEESRNKLSKSKTGKKNKPCSIETKIKIGNGNRGKKHSEEQNENLRNRMKGRIPWNKGRKLTKSHIEKLRISHIGQRLGELTPEHIKLKIKESVKKTWDKKRGII